MQTQNSPQALKNQNDLTNAKAITILNIFGGQISDVDKTVVINKIRLAYPDSHPEPIYIATLSIESETLTPKSY